jgi:hypothetical protein
VKNPKSWPLRIFFSNFFPFYFVSPLFTFVSKSCPLSTFLVHPRYLSPFLFPPSSFFSFVVRLASLFLFLLPPIVLDSFFLILSNSWRLRSLNAGDTTSFKVGSKSLSFTYNVNGEMYLKRKSIVPPPFVFLQRIFFLFHFFFPSFSPFFYMPPFFSFFPSRFLPSFFFLIDIFSLDLFCLILYFVILLFLSFI